MHLQNPKNSANSSPPSSRVSGHCISRRHYIKPQTNLASLNFSTLWRFAATTVWTSTIRTQWFHSHHEAPYLHRFGSHCTNTRFVVRQSLNWPSCALSSQPGVLRWVNCSLHVESFSYMLEEWSRMYWRFCEPDLNEWNDEWNPSYQHW